MTFGKLEKKLQIKVPKPWSMADADIAIHLWVDSIECGLEWILPGV